MVLRLALIAHDSKKQDMLGFVKRHLSSLERFSLFATATTGKNIHAVLPHLNITFLKSGPLGGDQQIGSMICEERIDALFFFVDPLTAMPHDVDVKALMRLAIVYDILMALNEATAEAILVQYDNMIQ